MSYDTIEAALLTVLKGITGYDATNTSRGDWRILGAGKLKAMVLVPAGFRQEDGSLRELTFIEWTAEIHLYAMFDGEEKTTLTTLMAERQKVVDEVNKWPFLNAAAGVMGAIIADAGPVETFQATDGAAFFRQVLACRVREANTFVRSE